MSQVASKLNVAHAHAPQAHARSAKAASTDASSPFAALIEESGAEAGPVPDRPDNTRTAAARSDKTTQTKPSEAAAKTDTKDALEKDGDEAEEPVADTTADGTDVTAEPVVTLAAVPEPEPAATEVEVAAGPVADLAISPEMPATDAAAAPLAPVEAKAPVATVEAPAKAENEGIAKLAVSTASPASANGPVENKADAVKETPEAAPQTAEAAPQAKDAVAKDAIAKDAVTKDAVAKDAIPQTAEAASQAEAAGVPVAEVKADATEKHGKAQAAEKPAAPHHTDAQSAKKAETFAATLDNAAAAPKPDVQTPQALQMMGAHRADAAPVNTAPINSVNAAPQPQTLTSIPIAAVAVEIAARAQAGINRFDIRLDPAELGRIDVRLDIDRQGQVTSRLVVERAETLDLLRRDAHQLERALQDSGLKTSDNSLQFSLRDQNLANRDDQRNAPNAHLAIPNLDDQPVDLTQTTYGRLNRLGGGVDIRV